MSPRRGSTLRAVVVAATLVALAGCSSGSGSSTATVRPASGSSSAEGSGEVAPVGFTAVTVTVTAADGSTREWCLWLADNSTLRAKGLMNVTDEDLGGAAGMLFSYPEDTSGTFWMRNTLLPLSIGWYDAAGTLVSSTDMAPCPADEADCPTYSAAGPYRYAIEVPEGGLDDLGLVDDATIAVGGPCTVGTT